MNISLHYKWNTLITSGSYIGEEMQAEFGCIPPAFLPIGTKFLIQHQLKELTDRDNIWISLPNDYDQTDIQKKIILKNELQPIYTDPTNTLGQSMFNILQEIGTEKPLEIIHGDTLIVGLKKNVRDTVSITQLTEQYKWGIVEAKTGNVISIKELHKIDKNDAKLSILSGYFAITKPAILSEALISENFNFLKALNKYANKRTLYANKKINALDCGHLKTYYNTRTKLASTRHFNSLKIEDGIVLKRSENRKKLNAEANWLRTVPPAIQPFTARLIENTSQPLDGEYQTLYNNYPTLAEIYLAYSPKVVWEKILNSCYSYLMTASRHTTNQNSELKWLSIVKLKDRLKKFPQYFPEKNQNLTVNGKIIGSLEQIISTLAQKIEVNAERRATIMHGDFCFSNILYDFRSDRIVLIDPRGIVGDQTTIYGDIYYDIAKFGHSIVGRYDQIIAGQIIGKRIDAASYEITIPDEELKDWLEKQYWTLATEKMSLDDQIVKAVIVSLFLSMIPLHSEDPDRQVSFLANALMLYSKFF